MEAIVLTYQKRLFALQDKKYQKFMMKLLPTVAPEKIIGVRSPALRTVAKELAKEADVQTYLQALPHQYQEENGLQNFLLSDMKDYPSCIAAVEAFLPYLDNWATSDSLSPKVFKKHLPALLEKIKEWVASDQPYTVRFGVKMLMDLYLGEAFTPALAEMVATVQKPDYYVKMMVAWYFATALAKQYTTAVVYLEENRLPKWTHNKTIQKAVESYRISDAVKTYLRTLRRK
ncbi:MAG TPA: DNA alkylation repair protein [Ruminococcaceae bacterium]|nr:DNA alkylation repair protein [Oscillospiraceae bacterium]